MTPSYLNVSCFTRTDRRILDETEGDPVFDAYTIDWLHLLARWAHILTGAAWIGTSFYFIFLNNSIRPPDNEQDSGAKVKGVVWMVHGGAFYRTTKYDGAPEKLPTTLHWFKWEAYLTWLSGVAMLALIYWGQARAYMVDPTVADITTTQAVLTGIGSIVGSWLAYDLLIKTLWTRPKLVSLLGVVGITALAYGLTQTLSARAAYIHIGAIIGTIMAANVLFVIIPNQRVMVNAMLEGREPDTSKGAAGALRSLHNNYLTLPVLFIMVSNHFPFTYGSSWSWAILIAISVIGAMGRHWFNLHERGIKNQWLLPAAALALFSLALALKPADREAPALSEGQTATVGWDEVEPIFERRCTPCHAENPSHPSFAEAPLGMMMDTPERVAAKADAIHEQSVIQKVMPIGNLTEMTDEERDIVAAWYASGAPTE
jgi:uncharacterized membrane protein